MEEQKKNPAQGLSESEQVQVRRQKQIGRASCRERVSSPV